MIESLDERVGEFKLEADICIVGAGAAGLLIAREFTGTKARIVILEGGGWSATDAGQDLYNGEISCNAFRGLQAGRSREFGGTTTLWGGQCIPMDPIDFECRSWVPNSGWPISYETLRPYYEQAKVRLIMTPGELEQDAWERFGIEPVHFDPTQLTAIHGVFIRKPNLGRRYRAELATAENIQVILHANVKSINTNAFGTAVSSVSFQSLRGKCGQVSARLVVLCVGGIENARLLLLSDQINPNGLGNEKGLVGRYLQDHPCGRTAVISTGNPRRLQDHYNMLYGKTARYMPKIALSAEMQRRHQTLNCVGRLAYDFSPTSGIQAARDVISAIRERRWPRELPDKMLNILFSSSEMASAGWRRLYKGLSPAPEPQKIYLETFSEQTPNAESRISLSTQLDGLGLRRVKVDWKLDELTGHTLRTFTKLVGAEFHRLKLGTLQAADWLTETVPCYPDVLDSYHPAGTTRMGDAPSAGVVDTNCEVFGVQGLYCAGSSVFPTSGAANPTLSIAAMAIRLAAQIRQDLCRESLPASRASDRTLATSSAN
jgi:choline dehydrogenase-like flavoprotein